MYFFSALVNFVLFAQEWTSGTRPFLIQTSNWQDKLNLVNLLRAILLAGGSGGVHASFCAEPSFVVHRGFLARESQSGLFWNNCRLLLLSGTRMG